MEGVLCLGKGRLSGAVMNGTDCLVTIGIGGTIRLKKLQPGRRIVDCGVVSYAEDCFILPGGKLEYGTEVTYDIESE